MDITNEINDWLSKFKYTFFNFKNGFFHLKLQTKSPQKILESFDKIPFLKHDKSKNFISTNNPMMRIKINYQEIEKGLWIMYSESEYKSNVFYTTSSNLLDNDEAYYFINLHTNNSKLPAREMLINGSPLQKNMWNIVKPQTLRQLTHFKNIQEKNITIYFNDAYLSSESTFFKKMTNEKLNLFFTSNNQFLCAQEKEDKNLLFKKTEKSFSILNEASRKQEVSSLVFELLNEFSNCLNKQKLTENYYRLSDIDRKNILSVEEFLADNLTKKFPGIDTLSNRLGVSSTKLKIDFKTIHETSIFQFYRNNQLDMAYDILENNALKIKHLAMLFGYENASKFSSAFKNKFGKSPSEIR